MIIRTGQLAPGEKRGEEKINSFFVTLFTFTDSLFSVINLKIFVHPNDFIHGDW